MGRACAQEREKSCQVCSNDAASNTKAGARLPLAVPLASLL